MSLTKQLTFRETTSDFTLMTRQEPDPGCASDWLKQISHAARPIGRGHYPYVGSKASYQYRICALVSQTLVGGETSGGVAK